MARAYYYLVAGLPQLRLDDYKEPYRAAEFISELRQEAHPDDYAACVDIYSRLDHPAVTALLNGQEILPPLRTPEWTYALLREQIARPCPDPAVPAYLIEFFEDARQTRAQRQPAPGEWENVLARYYAAAMSAHRQSFIRAYFAFDTLLRNTVAALNQRTFAFVRDAVIDAGDAWVVAQLRGSGAADFGLAAATDITLDVMELWNNPDWLHREKGLDTLRWQKIDALNQRHDFDATVLWGYLLKLMLVERWLVLDEERGRHALSSYTETVAAARGA